MSDGCTKQSASCDETYHDLDLFATRRRGESDQKTDTRVEETGSTHELKQDVPVLIIRHTISWLLTIKMAINLPNQCSPPRSPD